MSWLAKSLMSSLSSDHSDEEGDDADLRNQSQEHGGVEEEQPETPTRGIKEDISELTQTLTRQLWGFASFLSPPPAEPSPESPRIAGIRSDFAEIGGKLRSGISMLSNANAVSEISKIASSILPFGSEEEKEEEEDEGVGIVGITEEVLAFARNISMHSETWLDFPAFHDDGDSNDFEMSDAQQEHAMSVEHLAPSLAALRTELCPSHMSEGCFWKIYFVLLHSRLSKHDADILSTPQIVEARTMLLQDLQYQTKPVSEKSDIESPSKKDDVTAYPAEEKIILPSDTQNESGLLITSSFQEFTSDPVADIETEKHPVQTQIKIVDKSVIEEELSTGNESKDLPVESSEIPIQRYEDDGEDWSEEETTDISNTRRTVIPLGPEEDVSFSDLEDYDDDDGVDDQIKQTSSKSRPDAISSQTSNPRGWVQLNKGSLGSKEGFSTSPETKESNDWLDIEDFDAE